MKKLDQRSLRMCVAVIVEVVVAVRTSIFFPVSVIHAVNNLADI